MHSYLRAVGFSEIKKRTEMKEIILDVIRNYDEKDIVENHEDGAFAELLFVVSMTKITGFTWNIIILSSREPELRQMSR